MEPRALLVGEGDDLDREGELFAPRRERLDAGDGRDDAEHSVVLPGVPDGVEVRAEHERGGAGRLALVAPDDVADGIEPDGHARLAHPAHDQVARALEFGER